MRGSVGTDLPISGKAKKELPDVSLPSCPVAKKFWRRSDLFCGMGTCLVLVVHGGANSPSLLLLVNMLVVSWSAVWVLFVPDNSGPLQTVQRAEFIGVLIILLWRCRILAVITWTYGSTEDFNVALGQLGDWLDAWTVFG